MKVPTVAEIIRRFMLVTGHVACIGYVLTGQVGQGFLPEPFSVEIDWAVWGIIMVLWFQKNGLASYLCSLKPN